jgi:hypothetical protein
MILESQRHPPHALSAFGGINAQCPVFFDPAARSRPKITGICTRLRLSCQLNFPVPMLNPRFQPKITGTRTRLRLSCQLNFPAPMLNPRFRTKITGTHTRLRLSCQLIPPIPEQISPFRPKITGTRSRLRLPCQLIAARIHDPGLSGKSPAPAPDIKTRFQ